MHLLSIIFWVGAVVFLGYQLIRLFKSKPDRRMQVDEGRRRFLLPESEEESRVRYRAAWQKYRRLRVLFPLAFLGWLPFGVAVFLVFGLFHWNPYIATIIVLAWIPFISIFGWQWAYWQCPRCGYAFKGIYDPFFPKRCYYCDLPMWAESPGQ